MDWLNVPNLINALFALGAFAVRNELHNIRGQLEEVKKDVREAHKRIDDLLFRLK